MRNKMSKGQAAITTLVGVSLITGLVGAGTGLVANNIFSSPSANAAAIADVKSKVATLETRQDSTERTTTNQENKMDYAIRAIYKIATKLDVPIDSPPINK